MKTPEQEQPTVLPWHREAAMAYYKWAHGDSARLYADEMGRSKLAAIIARHDPHATTLRLLEASVELLEEHALSAYEDLAREIRAHLAAMKGTQ